MQLEEDGLPVQHDPALGYLNADQSFRFDETIDQVRIVRGGTVEWLSDIPPAGPATALKAADSRFLSWRPGAGRHWLAVLVRDEEGRAVLLSNPLYAEVSGG